MDMNIQYQKAVVDVGWYYSSEFCLKKAEFGILSFVSMYTSIFFGQNFYFSGIFFSIFNLKESDDYRDCSL